MRRVDPRALAGGVAGIMLAALTVPGPSRAQNPNAALAFEDFGFLRGTAPDARSRSLMATSAVAFDAAALLENPAGLARLRKREALLTLAYYKSSHEYAYDGAATTADHDDTNLEFVGGAWPIPVLRGSLVLAASMHRAFASDLTIAYGGVNAADSRDENYLLQQSGDTHAFTIGAGIDLSPALSGGIALFVMEGSIDALKQYDTATHDLPGGPHTWVSEDADYDVDGVGARIGLHMTPHPRLLIGLVITTPQVLQIDGAITREETVQIPNDTGSFARTNATVSNQYVIPYRVDIGVAVPMGPVRASAQFGYTDWSLAAIDRERMRTSTNEPVLRTVYDVRAGVEYSLPRWGVQLRAGAAHARPAPGFIEGDRIEQDQLLRVTSESGQFRLGLGAGLRLRSAWAVDAAWSWTTARRETDLIREDVTSNTVSLSGSYAF